MGTYDQILLISQFQSTQRTYFLFACPPASEESHHTHPDHIDTRRTADRFLQHGCLGHMIRPRKDKLHIWKLVSTFIGALAEKGRVEGLMRFEADASVPSWTEGSFELTWAADRSIT